MAEHYFGKVAIQVRFLLGAPSGGSLMERQRSSKASYVGSSPIRRAINKISGFGEMDIILVFETSGVGSIPASPAI